MALRGLDHLVIGVHDLDAAGAFYEKLGFTVGARNRHPWGTHNRIVQFDGTFLELITVGEPDLIVEHAQGQFSFGAFVRDALKRGEGFSMLVLESRDAAADNAAFHAAGIGHSEPFFFERQAVRPDGSVVRVAFSLAFADNTLAPLCGFFVCQQNEPQNFWNPAFQRHPNRARGVASVAMVTKDPIGHLSFLEAFTGGAQPVSSEHGVSFALPRGRIDLVHPDHAARAFGPIPDQFGLAAFTVSVPEPDRLLGELTHSGIAAVKRAGMVMVPASLAYGVNIAFEAA